MELETINCEYREVGQRPPGIKSYRCGMDHVFPGGDCGGRLVKRPDNTLYCASLRRDIERQKTDRILSVRV